MFMHAEPSGMILVSRRLFRVQGLLWHNHVLCTFELGGRYVHVLSLFALLFMSVTIIIRLSLHTGVAVSRDISSWPNIFITCLHSRRDSLDYTPSVNTLSSALYTLQPPHSLVLRVVNVAAVLKSTSHLDLSVMKLG